MFGYPKGRAGKIVKWFSFKKNNKDQWMFTETQFLKENEEIWELMEK